MLDRRLPDPQRRVRSAVRAAAEFAALVFASFSPFTYGQDPASSAKAVATIDFQKDVAPILQQHCVDCHGPILQLADLRLDQRQFVIEEGRERDLVVPGDSGKSLLVKRLVDKELGVIMPPTFPFFPQDTVGLAESQIQTLRRWIEEGANWPAGISLSVAEPTATDARTKKLLDAIRSADRKAVAQLLTDHALVNAGDQHGATPLMHATLYADVEIMRLLMEQGASVNAADASGITPLMLAAGDLEKVRLLLDHGAQINARSGWGRTPLLVASTYAGNEEVVRLLIQAGAKISDRDVFGETALTSASKRGDAELIEVLVAAGADVDAGGGSIGRTPLAWAAEEGNVESIACLLKHGAAKNAQSLNTALFGAAVRGPIEAVRLLLEHGGDPNAPVGFAGYTPLMGAAYSEAGSTETVKLLLDKKADVTLKSATGDTPLRLARKRGQTAIVKLLQEAGAKE